MFSLNRVISAGLALATLWSGASSYLNAGCVEPWNELSLSGAWSTNDVRTKFNRNGTHESFKAKDINVWKIGVQGHLSTPNFDCCCDDSGWLNNFYLRGYGYYGWLTDGKFHDGRHSSSDGSVGGHSHHRRKIRDGNTVNGNIGLGYLFPVCGEFAVGPAFGWAYDRIRLKNKGHHHSSSSDDSVGRRDHGRRTLTSTWQGPWLGVDFAYNWCLCDCGQIRLEAGYEYHWADLRSRFKQGHGSGERHNNHSFRSKNGSGNLVYVNAWYNLCDCWDIGLGFKWRDFSGRRRSHHHSSSSSDVSVTPVVTDSSHHGKNRNRWDEFEIALDLAYNF